jgi:hypothetical protein
MKKLNRLAISLLSGVLNFATLPAVSMEGQLVELEGSVNRVQQRVQEFAQLHPDAVGSVVVIGAPRIGKTCLHHLLAGRPLIAQQHPLVQNREEFMIHAEDPLPGFTISHTGERGTAEPCMWYDPQNRLKLFDFPGNNDPEGPAQVILNAIFAHELIQNQANAKVLFALTETDFDFPGYENLAEKLGRLVDMFESIGQLREGLNVVITKHINLSGTIFQEVLDIADRNHRNLLNTTRDGKVINLIRYLAPKGGTRVSFFSKPTQLGAYDRPLDRQRIFNNLLQHTNPIAHPRVNIAVTTDADKLVGQLGLRLNAALASFISAEEGRLITDYCLQRIANLAPSDITILRTAMGNIAGQLNTIVQQISPDNPNAFANNLQVLLLADPLTTKINTLKFLKTINPAVSYDTQAWVRAFAVPLQQVTALSAAPAQNAQGLLPVFEYGNGILSLRGTLLGTSDVNRAIAELRANGINLPINTLKVYSLNSLLIDEDLTFPGTLTCLMAPHLRVVGAARIINLSGAHGTVGANGGIELPGLPGGHGQHAGHFHGVAASYVDINNFSAPALGGNGGDGGSGGDGPNGTPGADGDKTLVTARNSYVGPEIYVHSKRYTRISGEKNLFQDQGTDATPGQNAGQGGRRGLAGGNGTIHMEGQWNNGGNQAVPVVGLDGPAGAPGRGGIHGKHCVGEKIVKVDKYESCWKRKDPDGKFKRHTAQADITVTTPNHVDRVPSKANDGIAPQGTNSVGQQLQPPQIPLNSNALKEEYRLLYNQQAGVNPFVRAFPNL